MRMLNKNKIIILTWMILVFVPCSWMHNMGKEELIKPTTMSTLCKVISADSRH